MSNQKQWWQPKNTFILEALMQRSQSPFWSAYSKPVVSFPHDDLIQFAWLQLWRFFWGITLSPCACHSSNVTVVFKPVSLHVSCQPGLLIDLFTNLTPLVSFPSSPHPISVLAYLHRRGIRQSFSLDIDPKLSAAHWFIEIWCWTWYSSDL